MGLGTLQSHVDVAARAGDMQGSRPGPLLCQAETWGIKSCSVAPDVGLEWVIMHRASDSCHRELAPVRPPPSPRAGPLRLPGPQVGADAGTSCMGPASQGLPASLAQGLPFKPRPEGSRVPPRPPGRGTGLAC